MLIQWNSQNYYGNSILKGVAIAHAQKHDICTLQLHVLLHRKTVGKQNFRKFATLGGRTINIMCSSTT